MSKMYQFVLEKDENDECAKSKFENVYAGKALTWKQIFSCDNAKKDLCYDLWNKDIDTDLKKDALKTISPG